VVITLLLPSQYKRTPWKNGGGTTTTIAEQNGVWQFGRTPITAAGPFSDYAGYDRLQVLVAGRGLVLQTTDGEIDVRVPFRPVRFKGEDKIVSRLEAGPVEVVNLIGRRADVAIELAVLEAGEDFVWNGTRHALAPDHALRIDEGQRTIVALNCGKSGRIVQGSILCVSR
jgi:environmental stress-induced protein Ves